MTMSRLSISRWDAVSCDYCSAFNGLLHWIEDGLILNPQFEASLTIERRERIQRILRCLQHCVDFYIACGPSCPRYSNQRIQAQSVVEQIQKLKKSIEVIELRYCPFKAFRDYYRNCDERYLPINEYVIREAGRVLQENQTVECYRCSQVVNDYMDKRYVCEVDQNSPMLDLMRRLLE